MQCAGYLCIEGVVNGSIEADSVLLGPSGKVTGHITCRELDIEGWLEGSYDVVDVVVHLAGTVIPHEVAISTGRCRIEGSFWGDLKTQTLIVAPTGQVNGRIEAREMQVYGVARGEMDVDIMRIQTGGIVLGSVSYLQLEQAHGSGAKAEFHPKA